MREAQVVQPSSSISSSSSVSRRECFIACSMLLIGMVLNEIFISGKTIDASFTISGRDEIFSSSVADDVQKKKTDNKNYMDGDDVKTVPQTTKKSEKMTLSWTEEDLKTCIPNYVRMNMTWWNDIVTARQQAHKTSKESTGTSTGQPSAPQPPRPIWLPGFPGSGNEMVGQLVQTLTGGLGGKGIHRKGRDRRCTASLTATCKTHWPVLRKDQYRYDPLRYSTSHGKHNETTVPMELLEDMNIEFYPYYIVLLRNPMNALPSTVNQGYEVANHLPGHSTQAPEEHWRKQRHYNYRFFVFIWGRLIELWESYAAEPVHLKRAMFLPYEKLTSIEYGPRLMMQMAEVIRQAGYEEIVAKDEDIPCLWYHVVVSRSLSSQLGANFKNNNSSNKEKEDAGTTMRGPHKYKAGYTMDQKQKMMKVLIDLKHRYEDHVDTEEKKQKDDHMDDDVNEYTSLVQTSRTKLR